MSREAYRNTEMERKFAKYLEVIYQETKLRPRAAKSVAARQMVPIINAPARIHDIVWQLFEIMHSEFVPRSYNSRYGLDKHDIVFESVGAHTHLVSAIVTGALDARYDCNFGDAKSAFYRTIDKYDYRQVMEAARIHDLAENRYGDIPDNGDRDEKAKNRLEMEYYSEYLDHYPEENETMRQKVMQLLEEMQSHNSETGRLLYLSDKLAALLITLYLDSLGHAPMMRMDDPNASARDREEMTFCDFCKDGAYKASEMWALDFFKMRRIVEIDETFFFTAILVMATFMVNGHWYSWREKDYYII